LIVTPIAGVSRGIASKIALKKRASEHKAAFRPGRAAPSRQTMF